MRAVAVPASDDGFDFGIPRKANDSSAYQDQPRESRSAVGAGVQFWRGPVRSHDFLYRFDDHHFLLVIPVFNALICHCVQIKFV